MLIKESVKGFLNGFSQTLNYPPIKEGVKNFASIPTIAVGIVAIPILMGVVKEIYADIRLKEWSKVARKIIGLLTYTSFVLSAAVTRPGLWVFSRISGSVLSSAQLERLFGPNTIFAVNPWHPRHVISFAALVSAVPVCFRVINHGIRCTVIWFRSGNQTKVDDNQDSNIPQWDEGYTVMSLILFYNIITSRPVLHWGNQFVARVIA